MASPVGHALAGYAIGRLGERRGGPEGPALLLGCAALAVAPDLHFVPGVLAGRPALYHRLWTHSLLAALAASLLAALWLWRDRQGLARGFACLLAACASHLLLDLLGPDTREPIGVPLLWPASDATFLSPVTLLPGIRHAVATETGTREWLASVAGWYNVKAILIELVVSPLLLFAELRARGRGRLLRGDA